MKRKQAWGNAVNQSGLWSQTPMLLKWEKAHKKWYDISGNISFDKLGIDGDSGCITYVSYNKKDVANWTAGVIATMKILNAWSK